MTKATMAALHLEWTPGWVRAADRTTGQSAEAARLSELGPILSGHHQALVGIGRSRIFLKTVRLPKAAPDDLRRILSVQMGQMFPLSADQLAFDFFQTTDQTTDGWLTVVGAVRAADLRELRDALKGVGIMAARILPVALAAPAVASRAGLRDALVAEQSPEGLGLDVVELGILRFSRVAPAANGPEIEARRTLAAAHVEKAALVAVGPVPLPDAVETSAGALDLLHEAPPFHLTSSEERFQEAKRRSDARIRLSALMMLSALLLMTLVWVNHQSALAVVKRGQGAWARIFATDQSILDDANTQLGQIKDVQGALHQAFQPAQPLSDISAVIAADLPSGAWLTGLTLERGKPMQVRGTAKSSGAVARLVYALGDSPRFRDVKLVFANSAAIGKIPVIQFDVSAVCVGNLPMPAPTSTAGGTVGGQ